MKRLFAIILAILFVFTFVGCAKITSQETKPVQAVLIGEHRRPAMMAGKVMMPADYDLKVTYEGIEYNIDVSRTVYYNYCDKIGDTVNIELVTIFYDDNTTETVLRFPEGAQ